MWPDRSIIDLFGIEYPILTRLLAREALARLGRSASAIK